MSASKEVTEVVDGLGETKKHRDARIHHLWARLCPSGGCELDAQDLQRGFRKIDHPLKNADNLLKKIMQEVDRNHDGKIQFEEFQIWVERAERQLLQLFKNIDKDGNGKLDLAELQVAFRTAGLTVSSRKLDDFFQDMDNNHDGYISFDEWRDFLLFMPAQDGASKLHAVMSYYNAVVNVSPEGDSTVSGDSLEGLGMEGSSNSLLESLFGSLYRVASPMPRTKLPSQSQPQLQSQSQTLPDVVWDEISESEMDAAPASQAWSRSNNSKPVEAAAVVVTSIPARPESTTITKSQDQTESIENRRDGVEKKKTFILTDFAPDPGYFLAGAIAGGVSRTATAPLDRLKVYLLVKTTTGEQTAMAAIKQGKPVAALRNAVRPFSDAVRDLYRAGGLRGFFAGNGLNVIKIMPETAIKFGSYEAAKRALANLEGHGDPQQLKSFSKFTAGGFAGMIAQFCVYPLDTLKFRLQCETVEGGLTGVALVRQTARKMIADGGLRVWYRGVTMGLVGMFPYSAIDMGTFELLKQTYKTYYAKQNGCHEDDINPSNIATGIIGASSGAFGATVVYPLNVVRTRLQTQGTVMHSATYTGIWDVTKKTIAKEGVRGLYKGLTPNMLKVAPALSITWVVYENSKRFLGLH